MKKWLLLCLLCLPALTFGVKPCGLEIPSPEKWEEIVQKEKEILEMGELVPAGYGDWLKIANKFVESIGLNGATIRMDDESIWVVEPTDGKRIMYWPTIWDQQKYGVPATEIYITTNEALVFSTYWKYKVVNVNTGETALVNLAHAPGKAQTVSISYIDYETGVVELINSVGVRTIFTLSTMDRPSFSGWTVQQRIVLGRNSNWNSSWSPVLLINIDTFDHARGILNSY